MLYDLYLREKLKKRPVFASDQKQYETAVWNYRKNNRVSKTAHIEVFENGTVILFDYENVIHCRRMHIQRLFSYKWLSGKS